MSCCCRKFCDITLVLIYRKYQILESLVQYFCDNLLIIFRVKLCSFLKFAKESNEIYDCVENI